MIVFDTVNPGTKATNQGLKPGNVVEPCSVQGAVGISPPKAPESSSNHLQRDESFDRSPKMFKSSKSIELNGTNAKEKTGKGSDAKGGSIPSSPISITVSSSKKVYCAVHRDRCKHRVHPLGWQPLPLAGPASNSTSITQIRQKAALQAVREQVAQQLTEQCIAQLKQACCDVWKVLSPAKAAAELLKNASPPEFGGPLPPPPGFSDSFEEPWTFKGLRSSHSGDVISTSQPLKRDSQLLLSQKGQHRPFPLNLDATRTSPPEKDNLSPHRPTTLGDGSLPCSPFSPHSDKHSSSDSTGSWWSEGKANDRRRRDSSGSNISDAEWKEKIRKFATTVQTSICSPLQESVPLPGSEQAAKAKATEDLLKTGSSAGSVGSAGGTSTGITVRSKSEERSSSQQWLSVQRPLAHGSLLRSQSSSDSVTLTDLVPVKLERVFITTDDDTDNREFGTTVHRLQVPISTKTESRQSSTETTSDALSDRLYDFTAMPIDSRQSSTEMTSETSTDIMPRSDSSETRSRTDSMDSKSNSSNGCHETDTKSDSSTLVVLAERELEDREMEDFDRPSEIDVSADLTIIMRPSPQPPDEEVEVTPHGMNDITLTPRTSKYSENEVPRMDSIEVPVINEPINTEIVQNTSADEIDLEDDNLIITVTDTVTDDQESSEAKQRNPLVKADSWDLISENLSEELSQLIANFGETICTKPLDLGKSHSLEETDQGSAGAENGGINKSPPNSQKTTESKLLENESVKVGSDAQKEITSVPIQNESTEHEEAMTVYINEDAELIHERREVETIIEEDEVAMTDAEVEFEIDEIDIENENIQIKTTCDIGVQDERSSFSSPSFSEELSNGSGSKASVHNATQTEESTLNKAMRQRERTISVAQEVSDVSLQTDESETLDDLASLKSDEVASLPSEGTTPLPEELQEINGQIERTSTLKSADCLPFTEPTLTDITELPSAYLNSVNISVGITRDNIGAVLAEEEEEECTDTLVLIEGSDEPSEVILTIAYSGEDQDTLTPHTPNEAVQLEEKEADKPQAKLVVQTSGEKDHLSPSYFNLRLSDCEYADASAESGGEGNSPQIVDRKNEENQKVSISYEMKPKNVYSESNDQQDISQTLHAKHKPIAPTSFQVADEATTDFRDNSQDSTSAHQKVIQFAGSTIDNEKASWRSKQRNTEFSEDTRTSSRKRPLDVEPRPASLGRKLRLTRMGSSISHELSVKTEDGCTQWSPQEESKEFGSHRSEMEDKETQSDMDEPESCHSCRRVEMFDKAIQAEIDKYFPLLRTPTKDKQIQVELISPANGTTPTIRYISKNPSFHSQDKEVQSDFLSPCFSVEYLRFLDLENTRPKDLDDPYRMRCYTLPRTARTQLLQQLEDRCGDGVFDVDAAEGTHSLGELQEKDTNASLKHKFPTFITNPRTRAQLVDELVGRGALSDGEDWAKSNRRCNSLPGRHASHQPTKEHRNKRENQHRLSRRPVNCNNEAGEFVSNTWDGVLFMDY